MSNNTRSSIGLGDSQPRIPLFDAQDTLPKNAPRTYPSRLQHSPSLPNIWFPPHSGPIPLGMSKAESPRMQRPSAPPSPKPSPPALSPDKEPRPQARHVKYASIDPVSLNSSGLKTHARRRTERDQPHSLLTPPLTPSSSIQTTASRDSSIAVSQLSSEPQDVTISEGIKDPDSQSTRILLLGNVNRHISVDGLKSAIVDALLAFASENSAMDEFSKTSILSLLRHDPLKGVNERHLISKGIIPVVFFDVRVAKIAKDVLMNKNIARLRECVGDEVDDSGERLWLSTGLVTLEDLSKTLGYSTFLDGIDGSFSLTIQQVKHVVHDSEEEVATPTSESFTENASDVKIDPEHNTLSRGGININILQKLVKSFGTIRFFNFSRQEADQHGKPSLVYNVEYYDSREAASAFKDLSNQVMFGMKIVVSRKTCIPPTRTGTPYVTTPFPNPSTAGESFGGLTIGLAGSQSQIRQRFNYSRKDEAPAKETDDRENPNIPSQNSLQVVPAPGGAPSPTFFYTSTPPVVEIPNNAYPEHHPGQAHGAPSGNAQNLGIPQQHPPFQGQPWDTDVIYRSDTVSPCYTPDGICLYCPSRGSMPYNPNFGHYAISPPTPIPIYYPTQISPVQMPNMINVAPMPNHGGFVYDYVDPQVQPIPNAGPWGFDPAIAAVGAGPNTMVGVPLVTMNAPSPAPFFLREDTGLPTPGRPYHHASYMHTPDQHIVHHQQTHTAEHSPGPTTASPKAFAYISTPESSPSSYRSSSLVRHEGSGPAVSNSAPSGQNERNQLNLAKIEEGGDTRTTVMIKNIPNKMSDSDLTAYIGKVCPRKVDFLYLRMDFKNGCNVGYAFVNFIRVQDLLHFAKERLGAKWNMFSSEKVLQMSYANYQGKEALIEKFKNSAIMDERESWRPRIFYSSGPDQGLIEPFPAPTHIRRKERSSYNRGTLFPPGTNGQSHTHGMLNNTLTTRRYNVNDDQRMQQSRPGYVERLPFHLRNGRPAEEEESRHNHRGAGDRPFYRNSTHRAMR